MTWTLTSHPFHAPTPSLTAVVLGQRPRRYAYVHVCLCVRMHVIIRASHLSTYKHDAKPIRRRPITNQ
jgi:hypothetical protein